MTEPELVDLNETSTAVIHGVVPMAEIAGFFDRSFSELATVLDRQGIAPAGPAFARYAGPPGETADLEVGFPVPGLVAPAGEVHPSVLPAGRVRAWSTLVTTTSSRGRGVGWALGLPSRVSPPALTCGRST